MAAVLDGFLCSMANKPSQALHRPCARTPTAPDGDPLAKRTSIDDERYWETSCRRISSIGTETSWDTVLPAADAINLRRPLLLVPR
jgi:hypothetical protein